MTRDAVLPSKTMHDTASMARSWNISGLWTGPAVRFARGEDKVSSAKVNPAAGLGRDADPQEMASALAVSLKEYYQSIRA